MPGELPVSRDGATVNAARGASRMMENRRPGEALMGSFRGTLVGTDPLWKGLQRDALTPEDRRVLRKLGGDCIDGRCHCKLIGR